MNVLNGANLTSLWSASGFMLGFGSASKAQPLRKPRMLRSAVTVAAFYLTIAYTCVIGESWLSATSESVPFPRQGAYTGSIPQLTRQLNQTMCDANAHIAVDSPYPELAPLCGMRVAGYVPLLNRSIETLYVYRDLTCHLTGPVMAMGYQNLKESAR
jgi:hypothetical protein